MATIHFSINHEHPDWVEYDADLDDLLVESGLTKKDFIALTKSDDASDRSDLLELLSEYSGYGCDFIIHQIEED